jgi:heme exporter protein A
MRGLNVAHLACDRGGHRVFSDLSFQLKAGDYLDLRGPNGSGKSSLLRLLAGLNAAASGGLAMVGGDPDQTLGQQAHYIGHHDALKTKLTVSENLAFWARFMGAPNLPPEALTAFNLTALRDQDAGLLSQGQKRRLALSRLLLAKRPLWLLDEPSVGLDTATTANLNTIIAAHRDAGGMVVASTHVPFGSPPSATLTLPGQFT